MMNVMKTALRSNFVMGILCVALNSFATITPLAVENEVMQDEDLPTLERISSERSTKAERVLSEYKRTGKRKTCLSVRNIRRINPLDERYFLFSTTSNKKYVNIVSKGCNRADSSFSRLQYSTSSRRLCRNEIISVVDNGTGFSNGSCGLGTYFELKKREKSDTSKE